MALINAVSGRHMRSIVIALKRMGGKVDCSVQDLFDKMRVQLGNKVVGDEDELKVIRGYMCQIIKSNEQGGWQIIETLTDNSHAVPPVFLELVLTITFLSKRLRI
eukprot:scaffold279057_cov38-Attheya_sp.AAC.2